MTSTSASSRALLRNGSYRQLGREPEPGQVRVLLHPAALAQVHEHSHSHTGSELGGVLLGKTYEHEGERYVEVEAALPALSEDRGPYHFTFNADVWVELNRAREADYPALKIVGWFHTHPGLGVFFSADDVVVHSAGFSMPWHVALVVDPVRQEAGFFGWHSGEVAPLPGFYELEGGDGEARPTFPWRPVRASVWDETFEERLQARRADGADIHVPAPGFPVPGPWLALGAGLGAGLATLLLLILGVWPLYQRNQALQAATMPLLSERLAFGGSQGLADCRDPQSQIYAPAAGGEVELRPGEKLQVVGVASLRDARSYSLALRPAGQEAWQELGTVPRAGGLRAFDSWELTGFTSGLHELRLTPLNRQGVPPSGAASCVIRFTLTR